MTRQLAQEIASRLRTAKSDLLIAASLAPVDSEAYGQLRLLLQKTSQVINSMEHIMRKG